MRIPGNVDYALRVTIALAALPRGVAIPAGELAEKLGLPRRFTEQQVTVLARSGLIDCRRGPGGGCMLARPPAEITVADIVAAVAGELLEPPLNTEGPAGDVWAGAAACVHEYLGEVALDTLAAHVVQEGAAGSYQI